MNSTNYTTGASLTLERIAEKQFSTFSVGVCSVRELADKTIPERLSNIESKCNLSVFDSDLLDQIGIDFIFEFMGVRFAVDVTTGGTSAIKNKKKKLKSIGSFLREIKAIPVVLCYRNPSMNVSIIEEIIRAPVCIGTGVIDCRI